MVKPGFLEHCLFVWILLCSLDSRKVHPFSAAGQAAAGFEVPEPLEPQVQFTGKGDLALCSSQVPGIGGD